jgi:prepilin-type N-terminal cleavage/methylation domain-containing protein
MTPARRGFTLIELTVVIFLIGLLFLTSMPKLGNFLYQGDMRRVARSLKATVYLLRSKSILTNRNTVLHIDLDRRTYWGAYEGPEDEPEIFADDTAPLVSPRELPKDIRFVDALNINSSRVASGRLSSTFNSKGVFEETVLHLADSHDRVLTIIINAYTGRFLLYDEYVDVEYSQN